MKIAAENNSGAPIAVLVAEKMNKVSAENNSRAPRTVTETGNSDGHMERNVLVNVAMPLLQLQALKQQGH